MNKEKPIHCPNYNDADDRQGVFLGNFNGASFWLRKSDFVGLRIEMWTGSNDYGLEDILKVSSAKELCLAYEVAQKYLLLI